MSATPTVSAGRPTGAESVSSLQTWARTYVSAGGQVNRSDDYFYFTGAAYSTALYPGVSGSNDYTTTPDYDAGGRGSRVLSPTGTITRTVYDALGRPVSSWVGTNDTPTSGAWSPTNNTGTANMVQVSALQYDGGGVGDSLLTQETDYPGGSAAARVTQYFFDWRDRQVAVKAGVQGSESSSVHRPISYVELNNLDEVTAAELYDGDGVSIVDANGDGVPDKPSSGLLRARSTAAYDEQGRVYETHVYSVNPSSGAISSTSLTSDTWFNHRGDVVKTAGPDQPVQKTAYDGAGRVVSDYTTDGGGDASWSDALNVTGDAVLQQVDTTYDGDGNAILVTTRQRFHDETGTGALGTPTSGVHARVSYLANYYDAANRLTDSADVGTNGGSAYTRPSSVPARSDTVLVSSATYNAAGWVATTTDPRGLVNQITYDPLGRVTKTIEDYTDGMPTANSNKTTEQTYDGADHVLTVKVDLPMQATETTLFLYGVTTASGSDVNSNDLLAATEFPDKSTGSASTTEKESYTVNALGETKTLTDRNGNVHTYSYDVLGQETSDAVTTLGSGVDGAVRRLETAYDGQGNAYLFTSYDAASGGNVVNQVQDVFNGLGQLTTEYQEHSGAVNTSTSAKVQYAYVVMASGANSSRPTTLTYPNGRALTYYNYNTGVDNTISRLSSISDGSTTLESYAYLGRDTVVKRSHPQPGVDLTYVKLTGESNGDAGDQYIGLDRFGRVVDQRWVITSSGTATDRFQYGYDRDGNVLYRDNKVNSAFGELYHANGASNGYDNLNQLTDFRRGTLTDTNSDGIPDTVTTASRSQSFTADAAGNFSSVTSDGTATSRTNNKQNQLTQIGTTTLAFDANGNLTTDENGKTLVYDGWNRLVAYKNGSTVIDAYAYDAMGRRIKENPGTARDLYYSDQWQVLEERVSGAAQVQYVWSPVYIDALIERDRDADGNPNNGLEERIYVQQDANWNVTAILSATGGVLERYVYDPFGAISYLSAAWATATASGYGWRINRQGTLHETSTGLDANRERDYSASEQRWIEGDPLGFGAGDINFYRAEGDSPANASDPSGLMTSVLRTVTVDELLAMMGAPPRRRRTGGQGGAGTGPGGGAGGTGGGGPGGGGKEQERGVGQPGFAESLIFVWGSGRSAVDHWQNGRYGWALLHGALAISDVFLVGAVVKGLGKLGAKAAGKVCAKFGAKRNVVKRAPNKVFSSKSSSELRKLAEAPTSINYAKS